MYRNYPLEKAAVSKKVIIENLLDSYILTIHKVSRMYVDAI